MEQLSQHIQISFEMVKAEDLKHMITEYRHFVSSATQKSTRERYSANLAVLKDGKKHTAKLLASYLKEVG
jgi:hypothetical protein